MYSTPIKLTQTQDAKAIKESMATVNSEEISMKVQKMRPAAQPGA